MICDVPADLCIHACAKPEDLAPFCTECANGTATTINELVIKGNLT
jgi:hypothetical protein